MKTTRFWSAWWFPLLLLTAGRSFADQARVEQIASASTANEWTIWLTASEEYRLQTVSSPNDGGPIIDDEQDHDLRLFLEGGIRDPSDQFGAELAAGLWWDLDGSAPLMEPSGVASAYDSRQPWWAVFKLQAEYTTDGVLGLARAGRQVTEHGLPVTFDGASLRFDVADPFLDLFLFGGRSVHFFEVQPGAFEDWIGSLAAFIRPAPSLRLELDYRFHLEDVLQADLRSKEGIVVHSYGIRAWYRHRDWLMLRAHLRGLDDRISHTGLATRLLCHDLDMGANLDLSAQIIALSELNEREDPFFVMLGESLPHLRWRMDLWKGFEVGKTHLGVHAGWNGRQLLEGEEGPFNRNSGKIYLEFEARDLFVKGLYLTVSGEGHYVWADGKFSDDLLITAGGATGYEAGRFKTEAGSYYQRYKYDYYTDVRETSDVRTFFGSLSLKIASWISIRARYELELADRNYHTVTVAVLQAY